MSHSLEQIDELRDLFPILSSHTYLNSCSLGALSTRAEERIDEFLVDWHTMGASAWYEVWWGRLAELRSQVGSFLKATAPEIALLPTTSAALSVVAESVRPNGRNKVICTELDFPTLAYQWLVKPEIELVILRSEDGIGIHPQQFADAVDDRTLFIATSHVFFATGFIQDIATLADIARSAGAFSLIDGYQGPGQIPVDLNGSGVDFYTAGPLKWLCGGPGLSYLFAKSELIPSLEPRITSWFAHEAQFEFDLENFRYAPDARRFELGTPSLPTVHLALGGQEILSELGATEIYNRNQGLTTRLVEGLTERGFGLTIASEPASRSAIVMVQVDQPAEIVSSLAERAIIVDHRPGHVRVSPHFYNTEDEVDQVVAALSELHS